MERIIENKFQKDLFEKYGYVKDEKEKRLTMGIVKNLYASLKNLIKKTNYYLINKL